MKAVELKELIGKTLSSVENKDNERLIFNCDDGESYMLWHQQDCCETVLIEDIIGDISDLVGTPILKAEEVSNYEPSSIEDIEKTESSESCTWTFYKFATIKGYVDVRWFGESSGYYSEDVDFCKVKVKKKKQN